MKKPLHIGIVAGEISGDLLAAGLIKTLREKYNGDIKFTGIGGDAMRAQGVETHQDISLLSIIGLDGIVKALPQIIKARRKIFDFFVEHKIDLFIGVDAPDFNIYFETKLAKAGIPCVHYVSPTVWAWRYNRVSRLKRSVKHVVCLFPFEKAIYDKENIPATFIGHPMAKEIGSQLWDKQEKRKLLALDTSVVDKQIVGLLPGSRSKEIFWMAPELLETAKAIAEKADGNVHFIISVSQEKYLKTVQQYIEKQGVGNIVTPIVGGARDVIGASDFVIAASGTITLECMFINRPMMVIYKSKPLSAFIARRIINLTQFALPNLLINREEPLITEYFQQEATAENMSKSMIELMQNAELQQEMQRCFSEQTDLLSGDADTKGANAVLDVINALDSQP